MRATVLIRMVSIAALTVSASSIRAVETDASGADVITAPKILARTPAQESDIRNCYVFSARRQGAQGRTVVEATIGTDGLVSRYELAPGIEPWQVKTAECVIGVLRFEPAKRNGTPVEAVASVPLSFSLDGSEPLSLPKVMTPAAEIEEIYRACYPADQLAIAKPQYRVALSAYGKAKRIDLVESTGVESLDQAGVCVLQKLEFEPARRGKSATEVTAIMPILLRPPK
jgi:outer membrane biosynthesis protein TonB